MAALVASHRRLVVVGLLVAAMGYAGWIAVLALTLPTRHQADHWNVTWVGFDVLLLASLLGSTWAVATGRSWAAGALWASAALLVGDAWFDVTTASGATATLVSAGLAAAVEVPATVVLLWCAQRIRAGSRRSPEPPERPAGPPFVWCSPEARADIPARSTAGP